MTTAFLVVAGITTPLQHILRPVLNWFHDTVGLPWAWSIIAITVCVRILLVPLVVRQIHSMQNLQRFAPEMKAIQQRYKQDKQKQQEELMKFYKEHKINPAASCLPTAAQIPVFITLYFVLREFTKEQHTGLSWLGFVPDISKHVTSHWSGYILLTVYVASQVASTYFMGTTMDKTQRNIMMVVPVFFVFFISRFPTGLVLYWMTTNLWTVGQGLITRRLMPKTPLPTFERRSSRTPPKDAVEPPPADEPEQSSDGRQQPRPAAPRQVRRKKRGGRR